MLLLYPHAFQSLIFNNIASRRIKEFGLKLIPGDLVYRNKEELDDLVEVEEEITPDEDLEENQNDDEEETSVDKTTDAEETNKSIVTENTESIFKRKVKALTEEDIKTGDYTIFDVVLPLPGYDITYPGNEIATWYEEMLATYNLTSEKLKHNVKTFAMAGAYRKLLLKPTEMSWEFRTYATPEQTLILSDFELLKGKTLEQPEAEGADKYQALIVDFCLSTSAYATMMLRELLKSDTSASFQTSLQNAALKEAGADSKEVEEKAQIEEVADSKDDEENKFKEVTADSKGDEEKDLNGTNGSINLTEKEEETANIEKEDEKSTVKRSASEMEETNGDATAAKVAKTEEEGA